MGASEKKKKSKPVTDRPSSGRVPANLPAFIGRLLAFSSSVAPGSDVRTTVERMLDKLVELEPRAAAAVWLRGERGAGAGRRFDDEVIHRASVELAGGDQRALGSADGRLFPELAKERIVALGGSIEGTLHFAAPSFEKASIDSYEPLLQQAACVIAMTVRMLRTEVSVNANADRTVQLEKLAAIGQTAASIVHELNNPLTAIVAYSDFLTKRLHDRDAPEPDVERLHRISEAAKRIQGFCRELSDYARPGGSLRAPFDLHAVIDRALGFCVHGLRSAEVTVERSYRDIPMLVGMDTQLTQVFVNLFTNAWHSMSEAPGGLLAVRTSLDAEYVVIEIADDGHGIEAHIMPHIFDSYFTTKPRGDGVGLGLSIVKQIIDDHGGRIRAERREPRGTVFYIELPVGMGE